MGKRILLSLLGLMLISVVHAQQPDTLSRGIVLKTNLLYDATSTINLGVEIGLADQWTLDISGNYNPWEFADNRKMKHWLIQPEARYWLDRKFDKHFFGFHLHGGQYNWGGMLPWGFKNGKMFGAVKNRNILENRYQGWLVGAGFSYGYHWKWSERWSTEFSLGLGYAYLNYDKYPCASCGEKLKEGSRHYFGPTKAAVSMIFILK
ncbi:DUF3575 domain-containing protein [Parabacteroides goldsteinii]|uniref:DUF3575 domain-containing protein n=1 Tax=Parabacteroides goldsteinii TaxID=328812 RepID=UPI003992602E